MTVYLCIERMGFRLKVAGTITCANINFPIWPVLNKSERVGGKIDRTTICT